MEEAEKVYIIHGGGFALSADFFVKRTEELVKEYDGSSWVDYPVEDCPYVEKFLEEHPDFMYVGSSDNAHSWGWGVDFDGWTKVDRPKL